jgi:hypothetical protein
VEQRVPILKQEMLTLPELNEKIKMHFKRQETRAEGQMSVTEDLDEFDRILVQIAMFRMMGHDEPVLNQE